ncbi:hypothetical protein RA2_02673 [Roseovarius sp. A-2]|uniref:hypothetical protein n=1 Tax=Roseovarius sp. A-2 TaxID=1570360 RepID=UPI0009B52A68|nr:hypothetical protein [Roseovarius sp. A-2]GAW35609.1 hypothetical protein RA2_02673 [Roseovarius sp. A-2]
MPLSILLPMVVVGIACIAVLLHLLGLSRRATLPDTAAARAAWLREFPADAPIHVTLCDNRSAALIATETRRGVVWPMGADTTARYLTGARARRTKTGLRLNLPDYTAPQIHLALDPDEVAAWQDALKETA